MKILYITTIGSTMVFFRALIRDLLNSGNTVDIATNEDISEVPAYYREWNCRIWPISCSRSLLESGNLRAVTEIKEIVRDGNYDIVHCHTPIAAACTRFACRDFRKSNLKVIYTAHGFHFYQGAPAKNWLLFYPVEKICSRWTDVLITINREDYILAQKTMKAKRVEYVPGVGIDTDKFKNTVIDRKKKRSEIGVPNDAFLVLSVGEMNKNKNHQIILRAIEEIGNMNIHYAIAGKGDQKQALEQLAKELGIADQFYLLGDRSDVAELYKTADVYALPSIREGLNITIMEALASGLPCMVSKIRGNVEMIQDGVNGFFIDPFDVSTVAESIKRAKCEGKKDDIFRYAEKFDSIVINEKMKEIYATEVW